MGGRGRGTILIEKGLSFSLWEWEGREEAWEMEERSLFGGKDQHHQPEGTFFLLERTLLLFLSFGGGTD